MRLPRTLTCLARSRSDCARSPADLAGGARPGVALLLVVAIAVPAPADASTRCYSAKSRSQERCMRYADFERRENCIARAQRELNRCIERSEPAATRPVMDVLPEPQPATDQCPPSAGGAPVACKLHVETIVQPHRKKGT